MKKAVPLITGLLAVAVVAAAAAAVHYRSRAESYRRQWEAARAAAAQARTDVPSPNPEAATVIRSAAQVVTAAPSVPAADPTASLREQVGALERQLSEKDTLIAALRRTSTNDFFDRATMRRGRFPSLEDLQTSDPTQYEAIVKRRQEAQQAMQNALALKADHLLKQGSTDMTDEERQQYDDMVRLMTETWQLTQQLQANLPPDERRAIMSAMRDDMRALDPLLTAERSREFYNLGVTVGYTAPQATNFAAYLNQVIDLTSTRNLFPGFRGGPGGGTNASAAAGASAGTSGPGGRSASSRP